MVKWIQKVRPFFAVVAEGNAMCCNLFQPDLIILSLIKVEKYFAWLRIMNFLSILIMPVLFIGCSNTKTIKPANKESEISYSNPCGSWEFKYLQTTDTFEVKVKYFEVNKTYCNTECIPYALIVGTVINKPNHPGTITILAKCDMNVYSIDQRLTVIAIEPPILKTSLRPCYFIKDTIINNKKCDWLVGKEHPAIWGKIIKNSVATADK